jgi:hypothetical protein
MKILSVSLQAFLIILLISSSSFAQVICGTSAQCPGGSYCSNNVCTYPPTSYPRPAPGCYSDGDCSVAQQCYSGQCMSVYHQLSPAQSGANKVTCRSWNNLNECQQQCSLGVQACLRSGHRISNAKKCQTQASRSSGSYIFGSFDCL